MPGRRRPDQAGQQGWPGQPRHGRAGGRVKVILHSSLVSLTVASFLHSFFCFLRTALGLSSFRGKNPGKIQLKDEKIGTKGLKLMCKFLSGCCRRERFPRYETGGKTAFERAVPGDVNRLKA